MDYLELFALYQEPSLFGRYISLEHIEPLLFSLNYEVIGESVLKKPIYKYTVGNGKIKVLLWSQMHGNESTTTKALFDFINVLKEESQLSKSLLENYTFCMIPMLNPDGAFWYTRENANTVDLNRDSQNLSQPESRLLRQVFDEFKPNYCYNLHDQRTIFGAGDTGNVATVSFLSPSYNVSLDVNDIRLKAMNVIVGMNETLQRYIPNQVGRFDDGFNINCIGDTFQSLKVPTILIEAGHFKNDYYREETRKYILIALVSGFKYILENGVVDNRMDDYLEIPQNKKVFYDFIYRNVKINYDGNEKITNFAAQFTEVLDENQIQFDAKIVEIGALKGFFGHFEYDAQGAAYSDEFENIPKIDQKADFFLEKKIKIVNGLLNI
jgi:hypothetical protein